MRCGWFHGAASLGSESYDTKRRLLSIRECVERGKYDPMTGGVCVVRGNRTSGRTGTVLLMLSCGVASVGSSYGWNPCQSNIATSPRPLNLDLLLVLMGGGRGGQWIGARGTAETRHVSIQHDTVRVCFDRACGTACTWVVLGLDFRHVRLKSTVI